MKLAFDLDEVIANGLPSFITFYNQKNATNFTYKDIRSNDFSIAFNAPQNQIQILVQEFYLSNVPIAPMPHAKEVLTNLRSQHELYILTSRPPGLEEATHLWLDQEFPNIFSAVYFCHNFHIGCNRKTKLEQCLEINIELLVDDTLEHLIPCASKGVITFLYTHIWNQGKIPDNIQRVNSWLQIEALINNY